MSLLTVHHPICPTERVFKILHFGSNLSIDRSGQWFSQGPTSGREILIETPPPPLHYAYKEASETLHKQYMSLLVVHHPIICRTERVEGTYPKAGILCVIGAVALAEDLTLRPINSWQMMP